MKWSVLIVSNKSESEAFADRLCTQEKWIEQVQICGTRELPKKIRLALRPDVILLDETAITERALRQVVAFLRRICSQTRTLVVGDGDLNRMIAAARANADGYVPRRSTAEEIAEMIDRAAKGEEFVLRYSGAPEEIEEHYLAESSKERSLLLEGLTPREREVTYMVAEGMTNRELSQKLNISVETARWHVKNALRKLGLRDRTELAVHWHSMNEPAPERRWENLATC